MGFACILIKAKSMTARSWRERQVLESSSMKYGSVDFCHQIWVGGSFLWFLIKMTETPNSHWMWGGGLWLWVPPPTSTLLSTVSHSMASVLLTSWWQYRWGTSAQGLGIPTCTGQSTVRDGKPNSQAMSAGAGGIWCQGPGWHGRPVTRIPSLCKCFRLHRSFLLPSREDAALLCAHQKGL